MTGQAWRLSYWGGLEPESLQEFTPMAVYRPFGSRLIFSLRRDSDLVGTKVVNFLTSDEVTRVLYPNDSTSKIIALPRSPLCWCRRQWRLKLLAITRTSIDSLHLFTN